MGGHCWRPRQRAPPVLGWALRLCAPQAAAAPGACDLLLTVLGMAHGRTSTRMVIGLGQGLMLRRCRHAVGARMIDEMVARQGLAWSFYPTLCAYVAVHTRPDFGTTLLVWPLVAYNITGVVAGATARRFGVAPEDITALHDDLDVKVGSIKWRHSGTAGGNGVKSIIHVLGTDHFARMRIGIGRPDRKDDVIAFVLSGMPEEDMERVRAAFAPEFEKLLDGPGMAPESSSVASTRPTWILALAAQVIGAYLFSLRAAIRVARRSFTGFRGPPLTGAR